MSEDRPIAARSAALQTLDSIFTRRELLGELIRREIGERYAGNALGRIWAIVSPLMLVGIYVFLFTVVFRVAITRSIELPRDYTAYILAGLIPWLTMQEVIGKSPSVIASQANLVKQIVFPIELLPARSTISSFVTMFVGLAVLTFYLAMTSGLPLTYPLLPVLIGLQVMLALGLCYLLSAIGVFLRDLRDFIPTIMLMFVYMLPILYLPAWVPRLFKPIIYVNPFSYMIWCYQDVLYFGRIEHPIAWIVFPVFAIAVFVIGASMFDRFRKSFSTAL